VSRSVLDSRRWVEVGTSLVVAELERLEEEDVAAASALPGWTRKHVIAHLAANANALGNLAQWARTGVPTPMYTSAGQRQADIEAGAQRTGAELTAWLIESSRDLEGALTRLTEDMWRSEVATAQGRLVPASEIPWLRAREVCVHAVDLGTGVPFADLPEPFLENLVADIRSKRGMGEVPEGPLPDVAAYLAGRPHSLAGVPELGPWL